MGDISVKVGTTWKNPGGRTWTVYQMVPPGRAKIRSGNRFGEMNIRDIRDAIARAGEAPTAKPGEARP